MNEQQEQRLLNYGMDLVGMTGMCFHLGALIRNIAASRCQAQSECFALGQAGFFYKRFVHSF